MRNAHVDEAVVADIDHSRLKRVLRKDDAPVQDDTLVSQALDILQVTLTVIDSIQGHMEQMLAITEKAGRLIDPMKRAELSDAFAACCTSINDDIEAAKGDGFSLIDSGIGILAFDTGTHKTLHVSVPHIDLTTDRRGLNLVCHVPMIRSTSGLQETMDGLESAFRKLDYARATYHASQTWLEQRPS